MGINRKKNMAITSETVEEPESKPCTTIIGNTKSGSQMRLSVGTLVP